MYMIISTLATMVPFVMPMSLPTVSGVDTSIEAPMEQLQAEESLPKIKKHRPSDIIKLRIELMRILRQSATRPKDATTAAIKAYFNAPEFVENFSTVKYNISEQTINQNNYILFVDVTYDSFALETFNLIHIDLYDVHKVTYGNDVKKMFN